MTGTQQVEEVLRRVDGRAGPRVVRVPAQPARGEIADHHAVEYFELTESLLRTVRREVLFVNCQMNGYRREEIDRARESITALGSRSVTTSVICPPDELDGHGRLEFLERISRENGARVRISTVDLHGMVVFDRKRILMWQSGQSRRCVLVHSPVVVEPLIALLDAAWNGACDLDRFLHYQRNILDEKTPQILRLLGSGRKDEVAARQLGISVRTYRRCVASLMEVLGAESRFEAGVKAAALGLIDVDADVDVDVEPVERQPRGSGSFGLGRSLRGAGAAAPWAARWCPR
ncbi:hypothetical protein JK361_04835 [Streptomyces sp. 5-8]|uniref:HTH luxR-type domain-containing protein n=1 Tax=Streptomyces musisoli TaxID=2802280 RepID=A0ABS1NV25_9ACTN|nr:MULTISPECIES: hypothetical protein [Streptomyces]MBL1103936.1 hypothetical protein [Streptomyces musisoli]MBY8845349.1 hypothetical protein [Streptomyces sp. SP2-10]